MKNLVVLTAIALFLSLALRSNLAAMLTYWWFSIFRPQDYLWMDVSIFHFPLIATAIFLLSSLFRKVTPEVKDPIAVLMISWLIVGVLATSINGCMNFYGVTQPIKYIFLLILVVLLSVRTISTLKELLYLLCVVALSLGYFAGKSGWVALLAGGASAYGANNLSGFMTGSNAYAMATAIVLFISIFLFQQTFNKSTLSSLPKFIANKPLTLRIGMILIIVGSILNIISLESRGSAIATFLSLLLFFILSNKKAKKLLLLTPVIITVVIFAPIPEGYEDRIASAFVGQDELDGSAASRPYFWDVATRMVADNPLGVGFACYPEYYEIYDIEKKYGHYRDVHSTHFQILSETGYLGLSFWILLLITTYRRLFHIRKLVSIKNNYDKLENPLFYRQLCNAMICSITVFILGGSFYSLAFNDLIWLLFGLTIATTKLVEAELKESDQRKL